MKFVIIGGDAAGMSAASRACRLSPETGIIVFEQSEDVSYSACAMPYNIADPEVPIENLIVRTAEEFVKKQGINMRLGHRVTAIDRDEKTISGITTLDKEFKQPYDKLLIATGASSIIPEIPGIKNKGVFTLKNLNDGRLLKKYLSENKVSKAVILGMGYIALEMAESFRSKGIDVVMVKPRKRILPWLNEELSNVAADELKTHQVSIYPGHEINSISKTESGLAVSCDAMDIQCQLVLAAVGVKPNSDLAIKADITTGTCNSISVDRRSCTNDPDIYSAGDCADAFHVVTGKRVWVPLALQANRAGRSVADNIFGKGFELQGIAGSAVFKVFNLEIASTGLNPPEALENGFDPVEIVIQSRSRGHGYEGNKTIHVAMTGDKKTGRLLGVQMAGPEGVAHRIHAAAVALHSGMKVADFWHCDLPYAPPFSPVWDPLLTAANQLERKLR